MAEEPAMIHGYQGSCCYSSGFKMRKLQSPLFRGGIDGEGASGAGVGNWTWIPAARVTRRCAQSTAGPALARNVGTASLEFHSQRRPSGRVEKRTKAVGRCGTAGKRLGRWPRGPHRRRPCRKGERKAHSNKGAVRCSSRIPPSGNGGAGNPPGRRVGGRRKNAQG